MPVASEIPPRLPLAPIDLMNTPGSLFRSDILTLSPSIAPPVKGLVGSMAITPTLFPSRLMDLTSLSVRVLFPAPGGPVMPMT